MIIQVDDEGNKALAQLCDLALKYGGVQALQIVNSAISQTKLIEVKKEEVKKEKDDKK